MTQSKTALVTGGADRLGRYLSETLLDAGYRVVAHYYNSHDAAQDFATQYKGRVFTLSGDLRDGDVAHGLIDRAAQTLGDPVGVLINNAAGFAYDNLHNLSRQSVADNLNLNLVAPMLLSSAFARQNCNGQIINILDQKLQKLTPEFSSYTVAKAGLATFTKTSAQALAPHIRVNAIAPGSVLRATRQSQAHFDAQRAATLLKRGVEPADVQAALQYLLAAHNVTGQLITIDGGQHLNWQTRDILGVEQPKTDD